MAKTLDEITPELSEWIEAQHMYFVASAPLASTGHVNLSPKGGDTFRVLGPRRVAYLDLTGSGVETIAHVRENERLTVMFCAFEGRPKIVRLFGRGAVHEAGTSGYDELEPRFPELLGRRSIITLDVDRIQTSCGFGVPLMEFVADRGEMATWAEKKGPDGIVDYWATRNAESIDGLVGLGGRASLGGRR